ncbi:MAG: Dabb family protein [Acidimicrobiia bacterium]|nr:Dabb family protein [Acidimicrobiia bacterium]
MIRHCALFRFQPDVKDEEIDQLLAGFIELKDKIGGIIDVIVGSNVSAEGLSKGFDHGIILDFPDAAAVEAYLGHPAHLALAAKLIPKLEGDLEGALPFDLEFSGPGGM